MTIPEAEHRPTAVALAIMAVASLEGEEGGLKCRKMLLEQGIYPPIRASRKRRRRRTAGRKKKKKKLERFIDRSANVISEDGGQIGASRYFFSQN